MSLGNEVANKKFGDVLSAFQRTAIDPQIEGAGDFYTVLTNVGSELKFMTLSKMFYDSSNGNPVTPLSGENFDYSFSVMAPKKSGITAGAFYYPNVNKGFVFYGATPRQVADQCAVYKDLEHKEFVEACRQNLGIDFDYMLASHLPW